MDFIWDSMSDIITAVAGPIMIILIMIVNQGLLLLLHASWILQITAHQESTTTTTTTANVNPVLLGEKIRRVINHNNLKKKEKMTTL